MQIWKTQFIFYISIIDENFPSKNLLFYFFDLQDAIYQGISTYEIKTKVNGVNKYLDLYEQIKQAIEKIRKDETLKKSEDPSWNIQLRFETNFSTQRVSEVMSKDNLIHDKFYELRLVFDFDMYKVESLSANYRPIFYFYVGPPFI